MPDSEVDQVEKAPPTRVRWGLWLVAVGLGFAALTACRSGTGHALARLPVYVLQTMFFLVGGLDLLSRNALRAHLPWAVALASLCLGIEVAFILDSGYFDVSAPEVDSYILDVLHFLADLAEYAYFAVLLPWAAGAAVGALGALLMKKRYGEW